MRDGRRATENANPFTNIVTNHLQPRVAARPKLL
jgi:hypothetical protein